MTLRRDLPGSTFCAECFEFAGRRRTSADLLAVLAALLLVQIAGCQGRPDGPSTPPARQSTRVDPAAAPLPPIAPTLPERAAALSPTFREVSAVAGIDFFRYDDQTGLHRMMEALGAGTALFDFDGDGRIDVFFTNGCRLPLTLHDQSHDLALFRNRGQMQFESTVEGSGLRAWHGYFSGCTVGDYNSDGFDDLFLAAYGPDLFLRNNGDGTFSDVTRETGAGSDLWGSSAAFADVDRDGHLDLIVINYVHRRCSPPLPTSCSWATAPAPSSTPRPPRA
jgi:hypothetical protein